MKNLPCKSLGVYKHEGTALLEVRTLDFNLLSYSGGTTCSQLLLAVLSIPKYQYPSLASHLFHGHTALSYEAVKSQKMNLSSEHTILSVTMYLNL